MRVVRINELLKREISTVLHTRFRDSSVRITISGVETSPDLKAATVYYGVIGEARHIDAARRFFARKGAEIRLFVGKAIVIKYLPHMDFRYDDSMERGAHLNELIDSLDIDSGPEGKAE